ncbi:MAG: hypothetical protein LBQ70_04350, partial [Prevotellaceae bacterium]|nr:hypothetical protein [Prevotellaceae bacterium]
HFNLFVACNIGSRNDDRAGKTQRCPSLRRRLRGTKQEAGSNLPSRTSRNKKRKNILMDILGSSPETDFFHIF